MITKRRVAAATGISVAFAAAVLSWMMTQAASAGPQFSAAQIPGLARAIAAKAGDPAPALIEHVTATRADANRLASGEEVLGDPGNQSSYLVVVRGHFTMTPQQPPIPPGIQAPPPRTFTYTTMTLVVDASTGQVTDYGLTNDKPNLAALGPVTTDATTPATSGG